jgi:hypothetical protein
VLGLLLAAAFLPAADPAPTTPGVTAPTVATATETAPSPAELLSQLPKVPAIVERDGGVWWQAGSVTYRIVGVDLGRDAAPLLDTPIGRLAVTRKLAADPTAQPPGLLALPGLLTRAQAAKLKAEDFQLTEGILTGIHLRAATRIVHAEGVLAKDSLTAPDRRADVEHVEAAVDRLIRALPGTPLNELGRKCLEDVLRRLPENDPPPSQQQQNPDDLTPGLARRIVRNGWLRQFFPYDTQAIATMEQLIVEAERFQPVTRFAGDGVALCDLRDAFERSAWTITTPTRSAFTQTHSEPLYYWALGNPRPMVVADLPAGTDPASPTPTIAAARLYQNGNLLAEWKKDGGLRGDLRTAWRAAIPAKGAKGIEVNAVTDFLPPHIVVTALNGDVVQLITEGGALVPPKDGTPAESERFLGDAARQLADPARLDLLGEYLLKYVYDSPDSRFPFLIGKKDLKGDIHQTAQQTVATVAGGMMRGDCDDLAELYQVIAERQGRLSYVISLPRHAAAAFAEKKDDNNWHTYVLQTGPALEFTAPDDQHEGLQKSLGKAFTDFDGSQSFDPNAVGLLLRFSGENTRGAWRLGWRIFQEPDYARTMIAVQRDWQYQTYKHGIDTMRRLVESGDQDNANYRELGGLCNFTGQYAQAVEWQREAIKHTTDASGRLALLVEMVGFQFDAKDAAGARATTLDILDQRIPELRNGSDREHFEATLPGIGQELVSALIHGKAWDLALRTLKDTQLDNMIGTIDQVSQWLVSPRFNQKLWDESPQLSQMRMQMAMFSALAIEVLQGAGPDRLKKDADLKRLAGAVESWLAHIAFRDTEDKDDIVTRYASAGRYYAAMLGKDALDRLLESVPLPTQEPDKNDQLQRLGGLAQMQLDLPWIALSPPYWTSRLMERFERERTTIDRDQVIALGKRCADTYAACQKLGIDSPNYEREGHLAAFITALIAHDANTVRERLKWVKQKDDKVIRDDTAQWIGDVARFLDDEWFSQVLAMWRDEVDYKPKYLWIAWRAALAGAPSPALLTARFAAERYKDDTTFREEYEFMKTLLEAKTK